MQLLAVCICVASADRMWKFDRIQELAAFQWGILFFLFLFFLKLQFAKYQQHIPHCLTQKKEELPSCKGSEMTAHTHKWPKRKAQGGAQLVLIWCRIWLEEKIYSKGCNETAEEIKYIRWAAWATWRAGWRQVRKKNTKGKRNTALKIRPRTP